ncbi:MAG: pyridoxal phosphate-dependent decarboxylase family protein [Candidatus Limnocylindrales bacterium]
MPPDKVTGPLDRFAWHPEPELIGIADEATSRPALERLGHDAWDAALDYVYREAFRRAMGEPADYAGLRRAFFGGSERAPGPSPAPLDPTRSDALLAEFRERLAPHQLNAYHPRTLSYFTPPPLAMSVIGELLAQVLQQGIDVWHAGPSGAFVEEEVLRWLTDLVGFPPPSVGREGGGSFGILTSGGVMANFMAMTLARDIRLSTLRALSRPPRGRELEDVRIYTSDQAHFSIARAVDELGFPEATLRIVAADDDFRLRGATVAATIAADRATGLTPLAICAVAGSTNTGSIDAIPELADVAEREGLWFHVDAAYGGAARLSAELATLVPDLHRADSVTVDPHKWFFQAYDLGALLVRRRRDLTDTFHRAPEYYRGGGRNDRAAPEGRDAAADELNFYQHGMEGTRRWRALKLWMSWKHLGTNGLARLVESNVHIARHLARRIAEADDFDALPADPPLSVVCFRHLPAGRAALATKTETELLELDAHEDRLQRALEASGDGWLSTTVLRGRTYLRAGVLNYLTTEADIDQLLETLRRLARDA